MPVPKHAGSVQHYPGARTSLRLYLGREPRQHCYTVNPHAHVAVAAVPERSKAAAFDMPPNLLAVVDMHDVM